MNPLMVAIVSLDLPQVSVSAVPSLPNGRNSHPQNSVARVRDAAKS
jgi:hypothetical protein